MDRETKDLPITVLLCIAPTRVIFDTKFMKRKVSINQWSWLFLSANLIFLWVLPLLKNALGLSVSLYVLIWILPVSRICEIVYAFYNDAFDHLENVKPRSGLGRVQRFKLLLRSYLEIAICYASLYFVLPNRSLAHPPATGFESLYFSWITITTTGFGDITPESALARGLCMTEIGFGLMLMVLAVGTYFSYKEEGAKE